MYLQTGTVVAGIYKEGRFSTALCGKIAEFQNAALYHEFNEILFVLFHI
jgi:hypothetical protein